MKIIELLIFFGTITLAVSHSHGFLNDPGDDDDELLLLPSSSSSKKTRVVLSGSDPHLNESGHASGSGPLIDDDEDYNYIEEQLLEPSTPVIPNLPTPSPTAFLPQIPSPTISSTFNQPSAGPSKTISSYFGNDNYPMNSNNVMEVKTSNNNDWLMIGSGDGFVDPSPTYTTYHHYASSSVSLTNNANNNNNNQNSDNNRSPPRLGKPINKIMVNGGSFEKRTISQNFMTYDDDDDDNINNSNNNKNYPLKFHLHTNLDWIYVLGDSLVMLPTVEDVSEYKFNLTAEDEYGGTTTTDVIVQVRQPRKQRLWYYEYTFSFPSYHNWREILYKNMTTNRNGPSTDFIVKKVEYDGNIVKLNYVNESLVLHECPIDAIKNVRNSFRKIYPDFELTLTPGMTCESYRNVTTGNLNYPPSIKNQIDLIKFSFGELKIYKVPEDFCYDPEEGATRNLKLYLEHFEKQDEKISSDNWLAFDERNQEFYGIPVTGRVQHNNNNQAENKISDVEVSGGKYTLICSDSAGGKTGDVFETTISNTHQHQNYTAEFSLHFTINGAFPLSQIRKFIEKVAQLFNSPTSEIIVKSYTNENSIVHFTWYNRSNPGEKELTQLRKILFSSEGPVDKRVIEMFSPEFNISGGNVVPIGKTFGEDTVFHFGKDGGGIVARDELDSNDDVIMSSEYSPYLVTYIIPSVLIAVMVLLSAIIACLLSRKKKLPGDTEIKVGGGVPVIFKDELDEQALLATNSNPQTTTASQPPPPAAPPPHHHHHRPQPPMNAPRTHAPPGYSVQGQHEPKYEPRNMSREKYEPPTAPLAWDSHFRDRSGGKFSQSINPPPYNNSIGTYVPP